MKILSIDPGYEKCGYAIFEKGTSPQFIASGLIKTDKTTKSEQRLKEIYDALEQLILLHKPDKLIIEKVFFSKNVSTAMGVSRAMGVICLLAAQHQMEVLELTPNQIKEIVTGYGNADKKAVQKMTWMQIGKEIKVKDDDESDAIACGLAACVMNTALL